MLTEIRAYKEKGGWHVLIRCGKMRLNVVDAVDIPTALSILRNKVNRRHVRFEEQTRTEQKFIMDVYNHLASLEEQRP